MCLEAGPSVLYFFLRVCSLALFSPVSIVYFSYPIFLSLLSLNESTCFSMHVWQKVTQSRSVTWRWQTSLKGAGSIRGLGFLSQRLVRRRKKLWHICEWGGLEEDTHWEKLGELVFRVATDPEKVPWSQVQSNHIVLHLTLDHSLCQC